MKILKLGQMLGGSNAPSGAGFENLYSLAFSASDYVTMGDADVFTINNSGADRGFSFSAWIKPDSRRKSIITKYQPAPPPPAVGYAEWVVKVGRNGELEFIVYGDNSTGIRQQLSTDKDYGSFIDLTDGNWHHIAGTFNLADASTSIKLYVDGSQFVDGTGADYSSAGTWSASVNTIADFEMSQSAGNGFIGYMDEVALFDNSLHPLAIAAIYNGGTPTDISGMDYLLGWWRNGDTAGTGAYPTIVDYSTNSNSGTMTNMASGDIVTDVP